MEVSCVASQEGYSLPAFLTRSSSRIVYIAPFKYSRTLKYSIALALVSVVTGKFVHFLSSEHFFKGGGGSWWKSFPVKESWELWFFGCTDSLIYLHYLYFCPHWRSKVADLVLLFAPETAFISSVFLSLLRGRKKPVAGDGDSVRGELSSVSYPAF